MRCHVHGKLEHAGVDVAFTISLDALTRDSAELYVLNLFKGPYAVPAIDARIRDTDAPPDVEIVDVDSFKYRQGVPGIEGYLAERARDYPKASHLTLADSYLRRPSTKGRNHTRNTLAVHRARNKKPFRAKYLRDSW